MKRNYERLSWMDFGHQLITSKDLDPLYYLSQVDIPRDQLKRLLLAYWCYYSAGEAAQLSEVDSLNFFNAMLQVYPTAKRGHERRHFRGRTGIDAIENLRSWSGNFPEAVVDYMTCLKMPNQLRTVNDIIKRVKTFTQFGDWIAWKIADMAERVLGLSVDFSNANLLIYKEPVKATGLILYGDANKKVNKDDLIQVISMMALQYGEMLAPPDHKRRINVQEIETVMCKYKAHVNGHYPLFNDTKEILEGLEGRGETAEKVKHVIMNNVISYQPERSLFNVT